MNISRVGVAVHSAVVPSTPDVKTIGGCILRFGRANWRIVSAASK
jgi:hypothetical protein